ncbi:MAG: apolipoprotein N-acyltransferase [Treponema sp.]|jgi:apolipoprotein N-acyltransferase|nr:apolipoprotein N-acyltransferase [Treponema sp.]
MIAAFSGGKGWGGFFVNLAAVLSGALLFAASFPNPFIIEGLPLLAWIAFVPVFWVVNRAPIGASVFWGALYSYTAYSLFNYWLAVFDPKAGPIVSLIYVCYFIVLFPLLKLALILFPKRGYLIQWLIWLGYEYLRTLGFLGYPYGISGYSQWSLLPVIQIASITGVWGVSALILFPSCYIAAALGSLKPEAGLRRITEITAFLRREALPGALWAAALLGTLIFGVVSPVDYSAAPAARIALIQHNSDPWLGGIPEFRNNLEVLKRLSEEALAAGPKPDLVVWSETAFVPRIYWHTTYRTDQASYALVKELMDFLSVQDVPFVIGNDDARNEVNEQGLWEQVDYNAVMLYDRGGLKGLYRKLHLVPFTESFPYKKQFPGIYEALEKADTHFWKKGTEVVVFDSRGLKFSTPICFEDTFGYLSRNFVRRGAEIIVNLSNDAWSKSVPAQMQHFSMAVFRAVENRRSMVRSTASGQTCAVDPNGKILAMAEPFTESWITAEVPVVDVKTPYTFYGDLWALIFAALAFIALLSGSAGYTIRRITIKKGRTR